MPNSKIGALVCAICEICNKVYEGILDSCGKRKDSLGENPSLDRTSYIAYTLGKYYRCWGHNYPDGCVTDSYASVDCFDVVTQCRYRI